MTKPARLRHRCFAVEGDGFSMRVQTVEGQEVSPEAMAALLGIGRAAAEMLKTMPEQKPTKRQSPKKKRTRR